MTKRLFVLFTGALFILVSCQKTELATPGTNTNDISTDKTAGIAALSKGTVSDARWYGAYYDVYDTHGNPIPYDNSGDPDDTNDYFISGGVATLPYPAVSVSAYSTSLMFDIPVEYNLPGDSIIYEAVVENGSDVVLTITGENKSAEVHFAPSKANQSSTSYTIGSITYINLPQLVNSFSSFQTIKLATKQGQTGVYVNNKLLYHFKYDAANKLGRIQRIGVGGKGSAVVDNVKLTNSYTNKKLMLEDFNTELHSHTIFY